MTTKFESIDDALHMGAFYAGHATLDAQKKALSRAKPKPGEIDWPHDKSVQLYCIKNAHGEKVTLGVGEFRDGYDLWLISPEGICRRV